MTLGREVAESASVELPYLRVANVQNGYIDTAEVKTVRVLESEVDRFSLSPGDVLLTEGGDFDKLGRGAVWDGRLSPCLYQNHIFRVRCNLPDLVPEYLSLYMASPEGRAYFLSIAKQTTNLATINSSQLKAMPVLLPSVAEQRRIVEVLEATDKRIGAESAASRKEELLWDGLINQRIEKHANEFEGMRLADVCHTSGTYGSNAAAVPRDDRLPRYVRITDIDDLGNLSADPSSAVSVPWESARPYILEDGDLLIARTGYTTGKSYLYRSADGLCAYAGYLVRFRVDPSVLLPEYAFMWTRANVFKKWVSRNVREVGQRNISAREYDDHRIAVPPLTVQRELVDAWEAARASSLLRQQEIARLRTLKQAIADDLLAAARSGA